MNILDNTSRVWVSADRDYRFENHDGHIPDSIKNEDLYDPSYPHTKLNLYKNIYKQELICEVLYDIENDRYLIGAEYDQEIGEELANLFGYYINKVGNLLDSDFLLSLEYLLIAIGSEMQEFIDKSTENSKD